MEIKKPSFEKNPTPNIDLDNQQDDKQKKSNTIVSFNNVVEDSPVVATHERKNIKKILIALMVLFVITVTIVVIVLIPFPKKTSDIYVNIIADELSPSSFDYSNIDDNRIEKDENGNPIKITVLPGDKFAGSFGVSSTSDPNSESSPGPVFIRFRMYATIKNPDINNNLEKYYGNIISCRSIGDSQQDWFTAKDGYIYYNEILKADNSASIETEIELIGKNIGNELQGKSLNLNITFEALQAEAYQSILEEWPTAPYQWRTNISEKYLGEIQHG